MDFSTLKSRVLDRLSMSTSDPIGTNVGDYVNEALHLLETSVSNGWPWMRSTIDYTLTSGTGSYAFSSISTTSTISKVLSAKVLRSTEYYDPLTLVNANEAANDYPTTATSVPESWFAEASTLYVYPTPDSNYTLRLRVVTTEPDLLGSGSTPVMPVVFHSAIVETAVEIVSGILQDTQKEQVAGARVKDWLARMKSYGENFQAAPRISVRDLL